MVSAISQWGLHGIACDFQKQALRQSLAYRMFPNDKHPWKRWRKKAQSREKILTAMLAQQRLGQIYMGRAGAYVTHQRKPTLGQRSRVFVPIPQLFIGC